MGLAKRLIHGKNVAERGAVVRASKTCGGISKRIARLYPIEIIENRKKEMYDVSKTIVTRNSPKKRRRS